MPAVNANAPAGTAEAMRVPLVPMPRNPKGPGRAGVFYLEREKIRLTGTTATKVTRFLKSLEVPEGPRAGKKLRLAPFQVDFIRGFYKKGVSTGILSVARGNAKTVLGAGCALGELLGVWDSQPRREVILAARVREQARIAFQFVEGLARSLPPEIQAQLKFRRSQREIEFKGNGGGILRAIAADGKNALGGAATFVLLDERGSWAIESGNALEAALMSSLGKRNGRAMMISTEAATDSHPFSRWLDNPPDGTFVAEHRPPPNLPADDLESLKLANPGCEYGIGASLPWLQSEAQRAIQRGGSALSSFRNLNRNERVSDESRAVLISTDAWLACEVDELPPRDGVCVVGLDLGGSMSQSAWASFWPATGRLECYGAFASKPDLFSRGASDGVGDRYAQMRDRGELLVLGESVVPVDAFINAMLAKLEGYPIAALCCDRFRQSELLEALSKTSLRIAPTWRGQGWKDSGEDCERFRQAVFDKKVKSLPSLLLRSALSDAVVLIDPTGASKIAKGRSLGRIDSAAASLLAVAEGARRLAQPVRKVRAAQWV